MTLADGCFDPIHVGHLAYLAQAGKYHDPLVIRVASDADIRAKGREPFQTRPERLRLLSRLFPETQFVAGSLVEAIRVLRPLFLVKGQDWKGRLPPEVVAACENADTRIVFTDTPVRSSTERLSA